MSAATTYHGPSLPSLRPTPPPNRSADLAGKLSGQLCPRPRTKIM
jgi:hypothetical protein